MSSIFTKIIKGDIPSYKIAENEHCYALLDISPVAIGHTLVIPKLEVDYYFDLDPKLQTELWQYANYISVALKDSVDCLRIGIAVLGLEVPHAHIHLIPLDESGVFDFKKPRLKFSDAEYLSLQQKIISNL